ncbi:NAD-dependent epimerase/dehydratase family protein [Nocardioides limicola]|uniref:NAD-dependent epimerase/dehydratase family protein n=1 Tax=Nocardioides limicola TaxID=2803368 RepID=UPI00193C6DB9|nr:NAD-dependent epimerase/dehydratase family protein [Nocardioides sp. DJM-14]
MGTRPTALVLGGTEFLGIHVVEALLRDGWEVSLFNRGVTNPDLFPALERLTGDRDHDASALAGRSWDVVYDLSGFHPDQITRVAEHLTGGCGHYVFVSTVSVYAGFTEPGMTEEAPLAELPGPVPDKIDQASYGAGKALCERRVAERFESHTIVRPTIIAGPHDPTPRFTYWPVRLCEPGPHLVPPRLDVPVQYLDARDLADWLVRVGAGRIAGVYNAAADPMPFADFLDQVVAGIDAQLQAVRLTVEQAEAAGLRPWVDLPLWLPPAETAMRGFLQVDATAAQAQGLRTRPLADTAADTLAWALEGAAPDFALTREREAEIIAAHRD